MPDNNSIGGMILKESLKNTQTGLTLQTSVQATQQAMLFNPTTGLPAGKAPLRGDTIMLDQYSGKTIKEALAYIAPATDSELWVDMGLPSGVLWAKANIDITTQSGFQEVDGAVSPFKYDCSFCSWGNTDMYNPTASNSFSGVYNWGGVNESEPYYDGQVYGSTPGNALTADFGPSYDAARRHLGAPWRMPSTAEFAELFANIEYVDADGNLVTEANSVAKTAADKRVTVNGIVGLRLRSKINGSVLFFPASGYGNGASWYLRGSNGGYWSSSWNSARSARSLYFSSGGVIPQNANVRYLGFAVRPVQ